MVQMKVDMERREKLRRLHTATHIINYCAREVLGNHVWQNGSDLQPDIGSLDITHYDNLTLNEIFKIEEMANQTIFENKKVTVEEIERTEAEQRYGFYVYQGGAIPLKKLRIITIHDSDVEACGGLHMRETGGIGLVKIVSSQKIQDGVIRLRYVVRDYALSYIEDRQEIINNLENTLSTTSENLEKTAEKFFNEWKSQKKKIERLEEDLMQACYEKVITGDLEELELNQEFEMKFLMELFQKVLTKKSSFKLTSPDFMLTTSEEEPTNYKKKVPKKNFNLYIL